MASCKCGCGQTVAGEFAQGHDARYKGELLRRMRREFDLDAMRELTGNGWLQKPFKFGVEIEFNDSEFQREEFLNSMACAGIEISTPGYTHDVMTCWKLVTDASCGLELVSPPMASTKANFAQIRTICALLRCAGAKVDRSCGLHVHVYAENMSPKAILRVANLYSAAQTDIDSMLAASRRHNSYCKHFEAWRLAHIKQAADSGKRELKGYGRDCHRYYAVNLNAYYKYGTLEFRQHQGTLNGTKVEMWARFVAGIMAVASEPMADAEDWRGRLYDMASMPKAQRQYWDARRAEFGMAEDSPIDQG